MVFIEFSVLLLVIYTDSFIGKVFQLGYFLYNDTVKLSYKQTFNQLRFFDVRDCVYVFFLEFFCNRAIIAVVFNILHSPKPCIWFSVLYLVFYTVVLILQVSMAEDLEYMCVDGVDGFRVICASFDHIYAKSCFVIIQCMKILIRWKKRLLICTTAAEQKQIVELL